MSDLLALTGLRATAFHGVFDHERRDGQEFIIDVQVWLDITSAARTDRLDQTLNYGTLAQEVVAAVERDPVDLIETVAERIAQTVLSHELVSRTRITLHKPSAPIPVPFDDVAITIERSSR
jgi:dihydroneopterin aldolase